MYKKYLKPERNLYKFFLLNIFISALLFLSITALIPKKANAQCANGWYCYNTRVTDLANGCRLNSSNNCSITYRRLDPHSCRPEDCEAVERYVTSCNRTSSTSTPSRGTWPNCNCGSWNNGCETTCSIWGTCQNSPEERCADSSWCGGARCQGAWNCGDDCDVGCYACSSETTYSCSVASRAWSNCDPGSTTDCYNCCARNTSSDPPDDSDPCVCSGPPALPTLVSPDDGHTTNDTNIVPFSWELTGINAWGEICCSGRGFRLQVDDDSDFSSPVYDSDNSGGLSSGTVSHTATLLGLGEVLVHWRVGARNQIGMTWSGRRELNLNYISPTAELISPANNTDIGFNTTQSFQADATDTGGPMTRMNLERARVTMFGLQDLEELDEPGGNPDEACAGVACSITREWTPGLADMGQWIVYMKAFDSFEAYDGQCTGSPIIPGGPPPWNDCGRPPLNLTDFITVNVTNTVPSATSITGPGTPPSPPLRVGGSSGYTTADYAGLFNLIYSDVNKQEVITTWASPTMTLETIATIRVNVTGIVDGAVPEMRVVIGNPVLDGSRWTPCNNFINGAQVIDCPMGGNAATSIDIYFSNKIAGSNMALIVDNIEIIYTDLSTRVIEAESNDVNGDKVIYDRAIIASDPDASPYDGIDTINGRENMSWIGSLRFPVPISFDPPPLTTLVTLTATATDELTAADSATKDITVCGSAPTGGLDNPFPGVDAQDVERPVTVEWSPPEDWGSVCGVRDNEYNVLYKTKTTGACDEADDIPVPNPAAPSGYDNYPYVPNCTNINDAGELRINCPDTLNAFDRDTDYCWFVEADNGEAVTRSYETTGIVWYFETDDPLDDKDWFTTICG